MFYLLSKVLLFLIQPLNWIFGLLLAGWLIKPGRWKRRFRRTAIAIAIVVTNPLLANLVLRLWEYPAVRIDELPKRETAIVLGGFLAYSGKESEDFVTFNEFGNRLHNALELYGEGKVDLILLSGRYGPDPGPEDSLNNEAVRYLRRLDFPDEALRVEYLSKNTFENIKLAQEILTEENKNTNEVILITSAFHMRRALATARKQGFEPVAFPSDRLARSISWKPSAWLLPSSFALHTWELLIKEWVGFVSYKMAGYS